MPITNDAALTAQLARGWNTWNTRSLLSHVLLPEAFAINLGIKDYWKPSYLKEALMAIAPGRDATCRPSLRAYDGGYTDLRLEWRDLRLRVQSATDGEDLLLLISPEHDLSRHAVLVAETGLLWNRPGSIEHRAPGVIAARCLQRDILIFAANPLVEDEFHVQTQTPYFAVRLNGPVGFASGRQRSLDEISRVVAAAHARCHAGLRGFGDDAEVAEAIQTCIAWNTIYDPGLQRVVTPVSRDWNTHHFGGLVLFGWDTFFAALLASVGSRELAFANAIAMAKAAAPAGFIPNWIGGTGCITLDRSMPQVGGLVVDLIHRRYPERWFLEAVYPDLYRSNRWYAQHRLRDGFICLGSNHFAPVVGTWEETNGVGQLLGAKFEFGLDNSPMYDGIPFDEASGLMLLADVGQMSLHIADSVAIAGFADELGRHDEARELRAHVAQLTERLGSLWDEHSGSFRNRELSSGRPSPRISPTSFYPLLIGAATPAQIRRLVDEHLLNEAEFWGEWVIPVTPRNDPAFAEQNYWRGKIWAPVNFLVYLALRRAGETAAAKRVADKSRALLLHEWRLHGHVHENYSADTGLGCDRPDSDRFYQWGGLLGLIALMEREAEPH